MKPLQTVAMGYVVIALQALQGVRLDPAGDPVAGSGYDLFPDPIGWLLVVLGVGLLPATLAGGALRISGLLALVVSGALWFPAVAEQIAAEDPSLGWAASLPALAFGGLLFHRLAAAAGQAGERTAMTVLQGLVTLTALVAVLPVLVFGAGWDGLADLAAGSGQLLNLAAIAVLFTYSARPWAGAVDTAAPPSA
ncbi:hypothetical protein [Nocardioides sp.]|uniref:hypothetical protein n=1 Tax=Nocardioides sp. TaxID=35761 RepID=UPI000C88F812|nr:hypothetical protein [Nocardioides sp.]MAS56007.1 hypothetical protein [Pimelobacter sp.]MDE0777299.1 hypothetical protein [Nocardioides sp.]